MVRESESTLMEEKLGVAQSRLQFHIQQEMVGLLWEESTQTEDDRYTSISADELCILTRA